MVGNIVSDVLAPVRGRNGQKLSARIVGVYRKEAPIGVSGKRTYFGRANDGVAAIAVDDVEILAARSNLSTR